MRVFVVLFACAWGCKGIGCSPPDPPNSSQKSILEGTLFTGAISIMVEPVEREIRDSNINEESADMARRGMRQEEDRPTSYNARTILLKRQFKRLIEDIHRNDVLRTQLFGNTAQSSALHALSTSYEHWRGKVAALIKNDEIASYFGVKKRRLVYEQEMNIFKSAYENLLENYYTPVYPPKSTLAI